MTLRAAGFPSLYLQGPGALEELPRAWSAVARPGTAAGLIVDPVVETLFSSLGASLPAEPHLLRFSGECTRPEIDRLVARLGPLGCGAIVGAGGGKALDTAKAVAHALDLPVIIAPTVASSDAPTSRIAAIYDADHRIVEVPRLRRNPDAVIVDTSVILRAPRRFFVAGIGDAITKRYEVAEAQRAGLPNYFDAAPVALTLLLARTCADVLIADAAEAVRAVETGQPNAAFERVVEATVLYSGLAFEGGGLSIAHGLLRGVTAFPETASSLHGELVAWGLLVQLELARSDWDEVHNLRRFLAGLGLPVTLAGIGLAKARPQDLARIAALTFEAPYVAAQAGRGIHPEALAAAIVANEAAAAGLPSSEPHDRELR